MGNEGINDKQSGPARAHMMRNGLMFTLHHNPYTYGDKYYKMIVDKPL